MGIGSRLIASAAFATALVAGTALGSNRASAATVLYDNLSVMSSDADLAAVSGPLYNSFSTGASAYTLSSFTLLISADNTDSGTFNVGLFGPNTTSPGPVIFSINQVNDGDLPSMPNPSTVIPVTFSFAPVALAANSRYWIGLSNDIGSSVAWYFSYDVSGTGVENEYFSNQYGIFANLGPNQPPGAPYQMQIDAVSATPLPASWTLMLAGLAGFGLLAAYRHRKNDSAGFAA